ncbi:uncharacterized protein Dwil_GK10699 [Drosophila willistoni]|uniref:Uncharacterized protein n=1 Tax=Drosophila willistoni TaxID=7260 RepID=B4MIN3_DROWI|nr:zinc finger protein 397 [Drosophila willistoni]EDW71972.2 uncharacterized protein Dwil_GK10699 [Drosophila willistoni]
METCGYICASKDYENFYMRCSLCSIDLEASRWQEFVSHFRNLHIVVESPPSEPEIEPKTQDQDATVNEIHVEVVSLEEISELEELMNENVTYANLIETDEEEEQNQVVEIDEPKQEEDDVSELEFESIAEEDEEEDDDEDGDYEPDADANAPTDNSPLYKFNPSFFRRDPRTLTFIELYEAHPCLWDSAHSDYKESSVCKVAYQEMIRDLKEKASIILNEHSLIAAIKKLHLQYNTVERRVLCGQIKDNSVAYTHYTSCAYLKASMDQLEEQRTGKIQLEFLQRNRLTTELIDLYAGFPQLYDPQHSEFSNMNSRKQAYETMANDLTVPDNLDINCDDIFRAIQCLRKWYYKRTKQPINASEKFYQGLCVFLPPKQFKQRLVCEICQHVTYSDNVLQAHMFKVHNIGELPFKCQLCDRSFMGRGELATHVKRSHIGKTHECSYCDRTFAVQSDLKLHMRTHTNTKPYICEHCGKAFRLRSQLKQHVTAIHTKIRAFKCTMCPKDFLKKVHLVDHIKSHLNIRDKICTTCGKGFTSCHSLIRHRQIHAEVKKFACKLCDSRFAQFVGLNSHMKRTHNLLRNPKADVTTEDGENVDIE